MADKQKKKYSILTSEENKAIHGSSKKEPDPWKMPEFSDSYKAEQRRKKEAKRDKEVQKKRLEELRKLREKEKKNTGPKSKSRLAEINKAIRGIATILTADDGQGSKTGTVYYD